MTIAAPEMHCRACGGRTGGWILGLPELDQVLCLACAAWATLTARRMAALALEVRGVRLFAPGPRVLWWPTVPGPVVRA